MAVAIGLYLAVLAVAYGCDALAKKAGVRWNRKWAWLLLIAGSVFGGAIGWLDGGLRVAPVGIIVGAVFAQLTANIIFGTNALFAAFFFGPQPADFKQPRDRPTPLRRLAILCAGVLPVLFSAVCAHELFWMTNMLTHHARYQTGLAMAEADPDAAGRERLVAAVNRIRWRLDVTTRLPVRLLVHPDDVESVRGTLAFADLLGGAPAPETIPAAWEDSVRHQVLWAIWQEQGDNAGGNTSIAFDTFGTQIANNAHARIVSALDETWVLRSLPRAVFVRNDPPERE